MYVYEQSEPQLWTVGFYKPDGKWEPESDHTDAEAAATRVAWLNGSRQFTPQEVSFLQGVVDDVKLRFGTCSNNLTVGQ